LTKKTLVLAFVFAMLIIPPCFADAVGIMYQGGLPLKPALVNQKTLASEFTVTNIGTEQGEVSMSLLAEDPAFNLYFSCVVSANEFLLNSLESVNVRIFFIQLNHTHTIFFLRLRIAIKPTNPNITMPAQSRSTFTAEITLDPNTTKKGTITQIEGIPIPEFNPLILLPLLMASFLILRRRKKT